MNLQTKIYIVAAALAAVITAGFVAGSMWSNRQITKLESSVAAAKSAADTVRQTAATREAEAAAYKQKIEYLEQKLTEIKTIARKQDEQLEKLSINSRDARGDVERARRTRAVNATQDDLCAKLAELGHACSE